MAHVVLELAAQLNMRSKKTIKALPSNLAELIVQAKNETAKKIRIVQEEISALVAKTRRKTFRGRRSLDKKQQSAEAPAPTPAPAPAPVETQDAAKIEALQEQLRMLKEQMEMFSKMQMAKAEPAVPAATAAAPVAVAAVVPEAPALSAPVEPAEPTEAKVEFVVPEAPPLEETISFVIPDAPALDVSSIPCAPPLDDTSFLTTPTVTRTPSKSSTANGKPPLAPSPSKSPSRSPATRHSVGGAARKPFGSSANITSNALSSVQLKKRVSVHRDEDNTPQPTLKKIYTRNLPGASEMSHTDQIKISAKIKLRATGQPRSPGGTPRRIARPDPTNVLQSALFQKFKNARKSVTPEKRRISSRFDDKENWSTD